MEEMKSLLHAVMERLDVQSANIEQIRTDVSKMQTRLEQMEKKMEQIESHVGGINQVVGTMQEEWVFFQRFKDRLDQALVQEEDWQAQITQALALCSQEKKDALKKFIDKHVG
ncbi:MAG: hypothetical protein WB502_01215 [Thermoactinomyces sp.]